MFSSYLKNRWQLELLVYWAILGAAHAVAYYREGQERFIRASLLEAQLAQSQLQALRMQLHPHFLFNTLQAVSVLTVENPRAAQRMLTQLGDLLRAVLDGDDRQEIPLGEELGFLRQYLEIEQVRFPDRLTVSYDVADGALDALVPSFVLQPLVENAIRYAIAPSAAEGRIRIAARSADGELVLTVQDSGPGFSDPIDEGVGLATTRTRLEKLYGAGQRMTLGRGQGGGAEVVVVLPFHTTEAEAIDGI
jgi:LytS/YehU family sensor histidine kinase